MVISLETSNDETLINSVFGKRQSICKIEEKKLDAIQLAANLDREDPKKFDKQNA